MQIAPFSSVGVSTSVDATTANARTLMTPGTAPQTPLVLRVVNEGTTPALIVMGDVTADATTSPKVMSVLPGERVFTWDPAATHVAYAMRVGAAKLQFQLGLGV